MATGQMVGGTPTSVADDAYFSIIPLDGQEIIVTNIYVELGNTIELYRYDGTNSILFLTTSETLFDTQLHCSYDNYIRVKNVTGSTIFITYDGMVVYEE